MRRYDPATIEPKWQKKWQQSKIYQASEDSAKPKRYVLEYFPYPSGVAMHVGHVRNYSIGDAISRYYRMKGYNVLHPMGWDAFGLPAENYAIKNKVSPRVAIDENTSRFKQQLIQMGFGYDWSREIDSTDPDYYRWTQWFFLLLLKKGLAYQKESLQWWCPHDKTVLANEQVENGKCWRCGSQVEKKSLKQWFFKITDYADRLDKDLDNVDWSHSIKMMQRNWIGHKTGINISYRVTNCDDQHQIVCFTTRPDTNFGATFVVLAPEHDFVQKVITQEIKPNDGPSHWQAVDHYVQKSLAKSDIERQEEGRLKTGVFSGLYVKNELTGEQMPVWVSDFVLSDFGTGAVVGVPGHDKRDYEFASQFNIPIKRVVIGEDGDSTPIADINQVQELNGKMVNSGFLDGLDIRAATEKIKDYMVEHNIGQNVHSYHLRDWLISRQRYWGAPIPVIHCPSDGVVPVPEDQLPVLLPEVKSYEPSGDGRSPLANVKAFVDTKCPKCGGPASRETDTMDGFACSSWYFLRFADPNNKKAAFSKAKAKFWLPVDDYIGGAEHAVMHLLYARFWTKVMYDEGLIDFEEPFSSLRNHGMILAPDGNKMSKSKGNTIEPDSLIEQGYGADSIRLMELFIGPWDQASAWSISGVSGTYRFLARIWALVMDFQASKADGAAKPEVEQRLAMLTAKAIKKVSDDLGNLGFNTAIATLMELTNQLYKLKEEDQFVSKQAWRRTIIDTLKLLSPFAPHITEELWFSLDEAGSIHTSDWPTYDEKYLQNNQATFVVQVNGKLRLTLELAKEASEDEVKQLALKDSRIAKLTAGKRLVKVIFVPGKLMNLVIA